jgi:hypothetical protein
MPAVSEEPGALAAEYGALREQPPSRERTGQLGEMLVGLLRDSGTDATVRGEDPPVVVLHHEGSPHVIGLAWGGQAGNEFAMMVRQFAAGAPVVLLSMAGFVGQSAGQVTGTDLGRTIMWDRTHAEAAVCGLVTLPDLLDASRRAALFSSRPYATLAQLLADPVGDAPARMRTPDRLAPPWPLPGAGYDGIPADLALTAEDGWGRPSGIAALDARRLVVVTAGGLIELDAARGGTSWILQLPGCVNEPLVLADGSVLAACNNAISRVAGGNLEAIAGGFDGNVHLLAGPDGQPWALSGYGAAFGGNSTLALTRLGTRAGDQHRYDIQFPVQVHTAGWLDGLRFFLAGDSQSAVVDLGRSTRVTRADWIESPHSYEQHLVVTGSDSVVTAAGSPKGIGVTLFRTRTRSRASDLLAEFELNEVDGLCAAPDGAGYLLGDVYAGRRDSPDRVPWPILLRLPGLRPPPAVPARPAIAATAGSAGAAGADAPAQTHDAATMTDPYDSVRRAAQGRRKDYALEPAPIDCGGQAEVFRARHKPSGITVALKRAKPATTDARARMRREIEAAQLLGGNPHVMPVLDHSDQHDWFVMPLAGDTAETTRSQLTEGARLRELVAAICAALRPAHEAGWIHRDLKPPNLLWLDGRWTVADWGLTRRPRGQTTSPDRTRAGEAFGTDGWAAPELSSDPHSAGPPADIYSIGQVIGWAVTGNRPQANTPLIPPGGPWRQVVKAATQPDPARRPPTVDALLQLIAQELDYDQPDSTDTAGQLRAAANEGDAGAAAQLFATSARHPGDVRLYTEVLPAMTRDAVAAAIDADPQQAAEVVRAAVGHVHDSDLGWDDASRIITWLHHIQVRAAEAGNLGLLEEAANAVLTWDAVWDQWTPQTEIRQWLAKLRGDQAAAVARVIREHGMATHFAELADDRRADERIRRAVRPAPPSLPDRPPGKP